MMQRKKSSGPNLNWNQLIFILGIVVIIVSISFFKTGNNNRQEALTDSKEIIQQNAVEEIKTEKKEKLTAWSIIKMTDWLLWPFILLTAAGIMLIAYYALNENQDKKYAQNLYEKKIHSHDIRGFARLVQNSATSRASQLMFQIIITFDKTKRAEPIGNDINQFIKSERDSFETFNKIIGFLSETAGALGLLGTVWGIFQTFHAGKMDGPTILQGMSVSLVTTLVGLIISLVLNMGATYVFTIFNNHLQVLTNKAEELRQVLLLVEKGSVPDTQQNKPETVVIDNVEEIHKAKTKNNVRRHFDLVYS